MADELFRSGLLEGQVILVAAGAGARGDAIARVCGELGATVARLEADPLDEGATGAAVAGALERHGRLDALVDDTAGRFGAAGEDAALRSAAGDDALAPLRAAADGAWIAARAIATAALIDAEAGGKLVFVAPAPGAGEHAEATRAAIENLARTLSIEWARYAIRPTAIAPGDATTPDEVAGVVAYLLSHAGDYFSGCVLTLGEAVPA
jgi:NAD(P)-dependent dehydrogenase (short-subunit alcohol dehydrogenase family)